MNELSTLSSERPRPVVAELQGKGPDPKAAEQPRAATEAVRGGEQLPPSAVVDAKEPADRAPERLEERVQESVSELNDYAQASQRDLRFRIDESSGRPVVSVVEPSTDRVIRQIPSDLVLKLAQNLKDAQQALAGDYRNGSNEAQELPTGGSLGLLNATI